MNGPPKGGPYNCSHLAARPIYVAAFRRPAFD
jgi:hypothetical protein